MEFTFFKLEAKAIRQHTGSAGSFFTLKRYNKNAPLTRCVSFLNGGGRWIALALLLALRAWMIRSRTSLRAVEPGGPTPASLRAARLRRPPPSLKNKNAPVGVRYVFQMVVGGGFEPPKAMLADLQSAPFSHSGIPPVERVRGVEPL